jgi:hypothetical protein
MMFPYTQGAEFFQALKNKVGWEGIGPCFADPPASTEQVLHPEKYFGQRDDPTELRLSSGIEKVLGEDVTELYTNTMGEFNVSVLLRALGVAKGKAAKAAAGWDGDRFIGHETKDGRVVVVWLSTWDSEQEAAEFEATYRPALLKKSPGAHLERRGSEVLLVLGSSGAEQTMLIRKGFRAVKVVERWSPTPDLASTPDALDLVPVEDAKSQLASGKAPGATAPGRAAPVRPGPGRTAPGRTAPAAPAPVARAPRLERAEEVGATFLLPAGFEAADDPLGLGIPSAYYHTDKVQLRLLVLPFPGSSADDLIAALREPIHQFKVVEKRTVDLHGLPSHMVCFEGTHRGGNDQKAFNAMMGVDLGDQTVAVIASVPAGGDVAAAKQALRQVSQSLWLDRVPAGRKAPTVVEKPGEERKLKIPMVLSQTGNARGPVAHSQHDARGAKVQIVDSAPTDLAGYAARLEARIPLMGAGGKVHAAGMVQRRGHEVYQIEFEVDGRRTHQMVVQAGGRLWTVACSAPSERFDSYRWAFGHVFGNFRVRPGWKYTDERPSKPQPPKRPRQRQPY